MEKCEVLGVEEHAPLDEVNRAYKRLSLVYHPDKTKGMSKQQQEDLWSGAELFHWCWIIKKMVDVVQEIALAKFALPQWETSSMMCFYLKSKHKRGR